MLFGLETAQKVFNPALIQLLAAVGLLLYASVGVVSMINGANFLDYNVLAENPLDGQHIGILLIELGVGITVASVMLSIFFNFDARRQAQQNNNKQKGEQDVSRTL